MTASSRRSVSVTLQQRQEPETVLRGPTSLPDCLGMLGRSPAGGGAYGLGRGTQDLDAAAASVEVDRSISAAGDRRTL